MEVYAIILPCIIAPPPMDAEEPTRKYTLHGWALLIRTTLAAAATPKVVVILKINCDLLLPAPLSVRVPDRVTPDVGKV
jgi:hypothetical protein